MGLFGTALLHEFQLCFQIFMPNTSSSTNSGSRKNMELGVGSIDFRELLKECSRNSIFIPPCGVVG